MVHRTQFRAGAAISLASLALTVNASAGEMAADTRAARAEANEAASPKPGPSAGSPAGRTVTTTNQESQTLTEVVVYGYRESLADAIELKKSSDAIVDAVSMEDVGKLPDNNVAEALQRVPGVRITRSAGEGDTVSIRGLSSNLTLVTVNGNVMPSSNQSRQFSFDIVAPELIDGIQVYKTPTADLEEGGVGGTINLSLPRPLDMGERFSVRAQGQYHEFSEELDPRFSAFFSRTFADETFGIAVSGTWSERSLREDIQHTNYTGLDSDGDGRQDRYIYASYIGWSESSENEQLGLALALQWQPNEAIDARFNLLYSERKQNFLSNRYGVVNQAPWLDVSQPFEIDEHGTYTFFTSNVTGFPAVRDFEIHEPLLSFDLSMDIVAGEWTISPMLHLADSKQEWVDPWQYNAQTSPFSATFDARGNQRDPLVTFADGISVLDPAIHPLFFIDAFAITPSDDEARSAALAAVRSVDSSFFNSIELGGKYTARTKVNQVALTRWRQDGTRTLAGLTGGFPTGAFFDGQSNFFDNWVYPDMGVLRSTPNRPVDPTLPPLSSLRPSGGELNSHLLLDDLASFEIEEKVTAGYAQTRVESELFGKPMRGNAGVRFVRTDQRSAGSARQGNQIVPVLIERDYTEVLPSLNVAMNLQEDLILRLAASRVMSRPTPSDLSPRKRVETTTATPFILEANPFLDPFLANQFDLSLERYFGRNGLLTAAVFYKDIKSFITESSTIETRTEIGISDSGNSVPITTDFVVTRPINGIGGEVTGIELAAQQSLEGVLPGWMGGFGYIVNYTYADSTAEFPDQLNVGRKLPLPDLSKHGVNVIAYFENERLSARVAYNWRSEFLITPVRNAGLPSYYDSYGQVDASFGFNFSDRLTFQLEAVNLTDELNYEYLGIPERSFRRYMNGRRFLVGFKLAL